MFLCWVLNKSLTELVRKELDFDAQNDGGSGWMWYSNPTNIEFRKIQAQLCCGKMFTILGLDNYI
jgi:hypothetical protein